jgi:predicted DCC family thiol-disulfide oxidoreductase YuxK
MSTAPVLLYDVACGFCAESVQTVLRHDSRRVVRFAPLGGVYGAGLVARHPELQSVDSMIWVEPEPDRSERVFVRSAAALRLAAYLGGVWRVLLLGYLLPPSARDALYDFVARHRHRLAGRQDSCIVVPPELRSRFLS